MVDRWFRGRWVGERSSTVGLSRHPSQELPAPFHCAVFFSSSRAPELPCCKWVKIITFSDRQTHFKNGPFPLAPITFRPDWALVGVAPPQVIARLFLDFLRDFRIVRASTT